VASRFQHKTSDRKKGDEPHQFEVEAQECLAAIARASAYWAVLNIIAAMMIGQKSARHQ
jgi:hypothetical protein